MKVAGSTGCRAGGSAASDPFAVLVFGADGRYIRTFGRRGAGPGELGNPIGVAFDAQERLWVVDPGNARYAVFDTAGTFIETRPRSLTTYSVPWQGGFDRGGHFLEMALAADGSFAPQLVVFASTMKPEGVVRLPASRGEMFTIRTANGSNSVSVPFTADLAYALDRRGSIWCGVTDRYRLVQLGLRGDTLRIVERPVDAVPVRAEERAAAIEELQPFVRRGGHIDVSRIPGTKPLWDRIFVDDRGFVWVSRPDPRVATRSVIDVFDPLGRYLGELRADFDALAYGPIVRGDYFYSAATDSLGTPYVIRGRLFRGRPGGSSPR